jgi:hypothetical protein
LTWRKENLPAISASQGLSAELAIRYSLLAVGIQAISSTVTLLRTPVWIDSAPAFPVRGDGGNPTWPRPVGSERTRHTAWQLFRHQIYTVLITEKLCRQSHHRAGGRQERPRTGVLLASREIARLAGCGASWPGGLLITHSSPHSIINTSHY